MKRKRSLAGLQKALEDWFVLKYQQYITYFSQNIFLILLVYAYPIILYVIPHFCKKLLMPVHKTTTQASSSLTWNIVLPLKLDLMGKLVL